MEHWKEDRIEGRERSWGKEVDRLVLRVCLRLEYDDGESDGDGGYFLQLVPLVDHFLVDEQCQKINDLDWLMVHYDGEDEEDQVLRL